MSPRGITREAIEALNEIEPYCFETDREEQWFNVGLQYGLDVADANPKSGLIDLSQVWHDSSEIPQHDALILFQSIYGDILLIRFQDRQSSMTSIQRWAYVDDLLPKGGKL